MDSGMMFSLIFFLLNILTVRAFKSNMCEHDEVINAVTTYNKCTVNAIKPTIGSLAMKAEDENIIDQTCMLLKKDGPIMSCAKENLGKCFETKGLEFNLKLTGQHAALLSMHPNCDNDDSQMEVDGDMFFAWLELEDIFADENKNDCDVHALEDANYNFTHCVESVDQNLIENTEDVKKAKETATNAIMKCFDATENHCFSEREMTFLRKDYMDTIEDTITAIFKMGDFNMDDEVDNSVAPMSKNTEKSMDNKVDNSVAPMSKNSERDLDNANKQGSSASLMSKFSILFPIPFFLFL